MIRSCFRACRDDGYIHARRQSVITVTAFYDSCEWDILPSRRKEGNAKREWYKVIWINTRFASNRPSREDLLSDSLFSLPLFGRVSSRNRICEINVITLSWTLELSGICRPHRHVFRSFKKRHIYSRLSAVVFSEY